MPGRQQYFPSPTDWRDEILYFLLPDRFSDGKENLRQLYDNSDPNAFRPQGFSWSKWQESGGDRFQGGTIKGIISKLSYLKELGATAIWVGPIFKQRIHLNTYHGYAIQDFLDVDKRFGDRNDLVNLIKEAHNRHLRIILDVIFNHSAHNWNYENNEADPPYLEWPNYHPFGNWLASDGDLASGTLTADDAIWPAELQKEEAYTRAGTGNLVDNDIDDPHSQSKRSDFPGSFRDFNHDDNNTLSSLIRCYKYWIALTDCDGFRIDTLKHVSQEVAGIFCNAIKEYATSLGKTNFFIVGEVAGPDANALRYIEVLGSNLSATLDIGETRPILHNVAKGLMAPESYFSIIKQWLPELGTHRNSGLRHVTILDDHDHVYGDKLRFSTDAKPIHQIVAGVAIQFFSLGIPCIYYGTEQAFAGPEESERKWLTDFGVQDRFLRETMFGGGHPLASGIRGADGLLDEDLPGFGAFGSVGAHFFDNKHEVYLRIASLAKVRSDFPVLRYGRQYQRQISNFFSPFALPDAGELIAWSRLLDEEESLCVINGHTTDSRGGDIVVDSLLNKNEDAFFEVIINTAEVIAGASYQGTLRRGDRVPVQFKDGTAFISIREVAPAEVIVLNNRPVVEQT